MNSSTMIVLEDVVDVRKDTEDGGRRGVGGLAVALFVANVFGPRHTRSL